MNSPRSCVAISDVSYSLCNARSSQPTPSLSAQACQELGNSGPGMNLGNIVLSMSLLQRSKFMSSTASKKPARKRAGTTSKRRRQGIARSASASAKAAQSLFEDLGFTPTDSRREAVKAELYVAILKIIRERGLTARQVGELLGKPHSRVSELLNGKLSLVTADTLIGYLDQLGVDVSIKVTRRAS